MKISFQNDRRDLSMVYGCSRPNGNSSGPFKSRLRLLRQKSLDLINIRGLKAFNVKDYGGMNQDGKGCSQYESETTVGAVKIPQNGCAVEDSKSFHRAYETLLIKVSDRERGNLGAMGEISRIRNTDVCLWSAKDGNDNGATVKQTREFMEKNEGELNKGKRGKKTGGISRVQTIDPVSIGNGLQENTEAPRINRIHEDELSVRAGSVLVRGPVHTRKKSSIKLPREVDGRVDDKTWISVGEEMVDRLNEPGLTRELLTTLQRKISRLSLFKEDIKAGLKLDHTSATATASTTATTITGGSDRVRPSASSRLHRMFRSTESVGVSKLTVAPKNVWMGGESMERGKGHAKVSYVIQNRFKCFGGAGGRKHKSEKDLGLLREEGDAFTTINEDGEANRNDFGGESWANEGLENGKGITRCTSMPVDGVKYTDGHIHGDGRYNLKMTQTWDYEDLSVKNRDRNDGGFDGLEKSRSVDIETINQDWQQNGPDKETGNRVGRAILRKCESLNEFERMYGNGMTMGERNLVNTRVDVTGSMENTGITLTRNGTSRQSSKGERLMMGRLEKLKMDGLFQRRASLKKVQSEKSTRGWIRGMMRTNDKLIKGCEYYTLEKVVKRDGRDNMITVSREISTTTTDNTAGSDGSAGSRSSIIDEVSLLTTSIRLSGGVLEGGGKESTALSSLNVNSREDPGQDMSRVSRLREEIKGKRDGEWSRFIERKMVTFCPDDNQKSGGDYESLWSENSDSTGTSETSSLTERIPLLSGEDDEVVMLGEGICVSSITPDLSESQGNMTCAVSNNSLGVPVTASSVGKFKQTWSISDQSAYTTSPISQDKLPRMSSKSSLHLLLATLTGAVGNTHRQDSMIKGEMEGSKCTGIASWRGFGVRRSGNHSQMQFDQLRQRSPLYRRMHWTARGREREREWELGRGRGRGRGEAVATTTTTTATATTTTTLVPVSSSSSTMIVKSKTIQSASARSRLRSQTNVNKELPRLPSRESQSADRLTEISVIRPPPSASAGVPGIPDNPFGDTAIPVSGSGIAASPLRSVDRSPSRYPSATLLASSPILGSADSPTLFSPSYHPFPIDKTSSFSLSLPVPVPVPLPLPLPLPLPSIPPVSTLFTPHDPHPVRREEEYSPCEPLDALQWI